VTVFHLHLVSDSTGETVSSVARSVMVQFDNVDVEEHFWALVRTKHQIDKVLEGIQKHMGFVLYTIADPELRRYLNQKCQALNVPCVSVLSRIVSDLSSFFGVKPTGQVGRQYELNEEYFSRVEAINFALTHDDGQSVWDLEEADIIIVGVSRSSKSPTSMYLAFRGFRAANVPYVPKVALPETLHNLRKPLIVGLTINPEILVQIRTNRLLSLNEDKAGMYTDVEQVEEEVLEARKYFLKHNWPIIDVTRRSVEETAAKMIQMYQAKKDKEEGVSNGTA
jgi:regulator of PEP synthase PpsR (kinase-PPPase family)